MNISPLDLRQQRFQSAFRGFDKIEVTSFLAAVADDYEQALRETDRLKQELAKTEAGLKEHREHEKNLQATLTTAQKLSDEIKANADKEAERILGDAEARSDLLLEKTQARLDQMQREIDALTLKRKDVETTIESTIQTLRNTLHYVRGQDARERADDKPPALASRRTLGTAVPRRNGTSKLATNPASAVTAASADAVSVPAAAE